MSVDLERVGVGVGEQEREVVLAEFDQLRDRCGALAPDGVGSLEMLRRPEGGPVGVLAEPAANRQHPIDENDQIGEDALALGAVHEAHVNGGIAHRDDPREQLLR
ncbi:hypothetical protein [Nocardia sp. bgisy118]|uniref:hypothetical protein n=1 Tax=Nocardia sp. bgisy118 TaxID=3413786 RepID=UPI003F4A3221